MKELTRRDFLRLSALAGAGALLVGYAGQSQAASREARPEDILIRGGTVYDGSLSSPRVADVRIKADRIVAIGDLPDTGGKVIDATGYIVTPGFIDVHTHVDMDFTEAGNLGFLAYVLPEWKGNHNYLYQGVTTVVSGNCGYGYTDTSAWLEKLKSLQFGTNVYHLAPHGVIRMALFGKDQPSELSPQQLDLFKRKIVREMEQGAVGMSTGLSYAPGLLSSTQELIDLNTVADVSTYQKADQYSKGIQYLLVNGVLAIDKGRATGERGGRALRRGE